MPIILGVIKGTVDPEGRYSTQSGQRRRRGGGSNVTVVQSPNNGNGGGGGVTVVSSDNGGRRGGGMIRGVVQGAFPRQSRNNPTVVYQPSQCQNQPQIYRDINNRSPQNDSYTRRLEQRLAELERRVSSPDLNRQSPYPNYNSSQQRGLPYDADDQDALQYRNGNFKDGTRSTPPPYGSAGPGGVVDSKGGRWRE